MRYNKLVRNKIPEIIKNNGQTPLMHIADEKEYWEKLKQKLEEESKEFFEDPCEEELADILEVISAIEDFKKFDKNKIEKIKKRKADERGSFSKRIILDEVED